MHKFASTYITYIPQLNQVNLPHIQSLFMRQLLAAFSESARARIRRTGSLLTFLSPLSLSHVFALHCPNAPRKKGLNYCPLLPYMRSLLHFRQHIYIHACTYTRAILHNASLDKTASGRSLITSPLPFFPPFALGGDLSCAPLK